MRPPLDPELLIDDDLGFAPEQDPRSGDDAWIRITQRSAGIQPVFTDEERLSFFQDSLAQATSTGMEIHAYCVQPRRYHLLVRGGRDAVARGLRELVSVFTQWINLETSGRGPVLHARSEREIVRETALSKTLTEMHTIPVEAGRLYRPDAASWSSYGCYVGTEVPPPWLKVHRVLAHVGGPVAHRDSVTDRIIYLESSNQPEIAVPVEEVIPNPYDDKD